MAARAGFGAQQLRLLGLVLGFSDGVSVDVGVGDNDDEGMGGWRPWAHGGGRVWVPTVLLRAALAMALALILLTLAWARRRSRAPTRTALPPPPSPPANWLLGHTLQLPNPAGGEHVDLLLLRWSKLYGRVLSFRVPLLPRFVVIADPQLAHRITVTNNFRKSPTYAPLVSFLGKASLLLAEGSAWASKRRAFNLGFAPGFLKGMVESISSSLWAKDGLLLQCSRAVGTGLPLNLHKAVISFTATVICRVAFGVELSEEVWQLMVQLIDECALNQNYPLRPVLNLVARMRSRRLVRQLDWHFDKLVKERVAHLAATPPTAAGGARPPSRDVLSLAIAHAGVGSFRGPAATEAVSEVTAQLKTFYFAGHDTTATLISWTIWLLASHAADCNAVRAEVRRELPSWVAATGSDAQPQELPSYEGLQRCAYLEAVLKEALRLYPPGGTARYGEDADFSHDGYALGGCILYISHYVLHRYPENWDRPDEFLPRRFLPVEAGAAPAPQDFAYMPFSRGPRDCIGKYFAMLEAKIAVSALVCAFDFEVVGVDETISMRLTSHPMHGARVWVSRASESACA